MRNGHGEKSVWRRSSRAHSLRFWGQSSTVVPAQIQDLGLLATPTLLKNVLWAERESVCVPPVRLNVCAKQLYVFCSCCSFEVGQNIMLLWYNFLLKVWMQDVKAKAAESEELILSEYIAEPALPQELRESFYEFQKHVEEYVSSETVATLSLLLNSCSSAKSVPVTKTVASVNAIKKHLLRQIIDWFSGVVRHWCAWYRECDNFSEIKQLISNELRIWCIRTLAAKYRIREKEIGNRFDSEPSRIPSTQETELEVADETAEAFTANEALIYRFPYNGLCLLSLARMVSQSWPCNCFVFGRAQKQHPVFIILFMLWKGRDFQAGRQVLKLNSS
ncbi:hypothetical protein KPL71_021831 [Citrus sinensis]|uniref:Uncharacterized protein n=1 Tax=Citrus sinensis TaxID=2711 RepID=A0ACB8JII7_CITSI|nr:hypothetical protein KPL71_021831 [Citrus sinensis]